MDNIYLEVINDRNEDTVVVIETQQSSDLEETESDSNYLESFDISFGISNENSIENHKRDVNRIQKKYYVWIRSLFAILISVGYPFHNWLISGDPLGDTYSKYKKWWKVNEWFYIIMASLDLCLILLNAFIDNNVFICIFAGISNITSIYSLVAFHVLRNKEATNLMTSCFITSDTESQIINTEVLETKPRIKVILHIISIVCLSSFPVLVAVDFIIIPFYGLKPIVLTLTAINLMAITINFVIFL